LQPGFSVLMCESDPEKARALTAKGFAVTALAEALAEADFVFLAVPDAVIGAVSIKPRPS